MPLHYLVDKAERTAHSDAPAKTDKHIHQQGLTMPWFQIHCKLSQMGLVKLQTDGDGENARSGIKQFNLLFMEIEYSCHKQNSYSTHLDMNIGIPTLTKYHHPTREGLSKMVTVVSSHLSKPASLSGPN